jgi:hypothetical protein
MNVTELLGLDDLLAQLILAVGAAMVLGNGFAIIQHSRGRHPDQASGQFHSGRAWWLLSVGLLITLWGVGSLATS